MSDNRTLSLATHEHKMGVCFVVFFLCGANESTRESNQFVVSFQYALAAKLSGFV